MGPEVPMDSKRSPKGPPCVPSRPGQALVPGVPFSGALGKGSRQILLFPTNTTGPLTLPFQVLSDFLAPHRGGAGEQGEEGGEIQRLILGR